MLDIIDLPRLDRFRTRLDHAWKIIGMNGAYQRPVPQLLVCLSEILQSLTVEKLDVAPRRHRYHEAGNTIDDLLPGPFPGTQILLSPLAVLDVQIGAIPFDDLPRFVPQRAGAKQEPSIGAVEPAQSRLGLSRLPRSHDALPRRRQSVQIHRMDRCRPAPVL